MDYPQNYGLPFLDIHGLRIVDVTANLPGGATAYQARTHPKGIRKIILHHHAGNAHSTGLPGWPLPNTELPAGQPADGKKQAAPYRGSPLMAIQSAEYMTGTRGFPAYGYNYDVAYHEELSAGRRVIYNTQPDDRISWHTGAGQNEMGISISHMGSLRESSHYTGQYTAPNDGKPSDFQKAVLPDIVRVLQDRYAISDLHISGHFQHGKGDCPGWDLEFWAMQRQTRSRRAERAFCWPIKPPAGSDPSFLTARSAKNEAAMLFTNTERGGSGFYPFGRQFIWHGGVHLFADLNDPVYAVADGWVVAARLNKNVTQDGLDYGSANFVLIYHEDPGLRDRFDDNRTREIWQKPVTKEVNGVKVTIWEDLDCHRPLRYYSLYMHLAPLDETIAWVARLRERLKVGAPGAQTDGPHWTTFSGSPDVARHLGPAALPIKAGEIIGKIGTHNPFAAWPEGAPRAHERAFHPNNRHVLHFEMFSPDKVWGPRAPGAPKPNGPRVEACPGLLESFDPNPKRHTRWTLADADLDVYADDIVNKLDALDGFPDTEIAALRHLIARAPEFEAQGGFLANDPSTWGGLILHDLSNALSKVVVRHSPEWKADWRRVVDTHGPAWGLTTAARTHLKAMVAKFQWWTEAAATWQGWNARSAGLSSDLIEKPYHYHPIRLLLYLHGLERTLDHEPTGGIDAEGFPISSNIWADMPAFTALRAKAKKNDTTIQIPASVDARRLDSGAIRIKGHTQVYSILAHTTASGSHTLQISPGLEADAARGVSVKVGTYGWHYRAKVDWETDL